MWKKNISRHFAKIMKKEQSKNSTNLNTLRSTSLLTQQSNRMRTLRKKAQKNNSSRTKKIKLNKSKMKKVRQ